jgi:hypothetical protein
MGSNPLRDANLFNALQGRSKPALAFSYTLATKLSYFRDLLGPLSRFRDHPSLLHNGQWTPWCRAPGDATMDHRDARKTAPLEQAAPDDTKSPVGGAFARVLREQLLKRSLASREALKKVYHSCSNGRLSGRSFAISWGPAVRLIRTISIVTEKLDLVSLDSTFKGRPRFSVQRIFARFL